MPTLTAIAWVGIGLGCLSLIVILLDLSRGHAQPMWIMNVVWPITALYSGPIGLRAYYRLGRSRGSQHGCGSHASASHGSRSHGSESPASGADTAQRTPSRAGRPSWQATLLATTHCGGGCALGDFVAEGFTSRFPIILLGRPLFGTWLIDFIAAFVFGIAFQYFSIKPMRALTAGEALRDALKADSASLVAWQVGMYGWMALVMFVLLPEGSAHAGPVFWFTMQIAMLVGFATSFPVNWWLLEAGIKEPM